MKLKKGDTVISLSGTDRGKRGKILRVLPGEGRVIVDGLNLKKKHRRSRRQDRKGEIILLPAPVAASSVAAVCGKCGKSTRIGYGFNGAGVKVRKCSKCGETL